MLVSYLQDPVYDLEQEDDEGGRCMYDQLCSAPGATKYSCTACGGMYHHLCANKIFGLELGQGCGCVEVFSHFILY